MSFQVATGFGYRFNIVQRGKGAHNCYFCSEKRTGVENSYHCMGVPRTFGRHCSYDYKVDATLFRSKKVLSQDFASKEYCIYKFLAMSMENLARLHQKPIISRAI